MSKLDFKIDPLTGERFIPSRSNQIFENSTNRIKYNNQKARNLKNELAYINEPVLLNRKILEELLTHKKEETFHMQFLLGKGYNFSVMTHMENFNNKLYSCIYKFMIIPLENNNVKLRKND